MFKHLLVPTDGSASAELAIGAIMRFARDAGAGVTGLHVVQPFHVLSLKADVIEATPEQYEVESAERARGYLLSMEQAARECGVACDIVVVRADAVHAAIVQTAYERQCDLIAMASHGRKGVRALLLGSETQNVLTHTQIPVLVFR